MPDALISIRSEQLSADINPLGAQLFALRDADGKNLLWDGDPKFWTGRAPLLFPIVGMLVDDRFRYDGKTYELAKHGFARKKPFTVLSADQDAAEFRLRADADTLAHYPFQFQLDLRFVVKGPRLTLTAVIRNLGETPMPASFGFHPALRWPLPYGAPRAEHRLAFDRDEPAPIRRIDKEGVVKPESYPTPVVGKDLALKDDLFVDDAVIFDQLQSASLSYGAPEGPQLKVEFPDTPYLGVWTKPGAGYICVEPWHGVADPQGFDGDIWEKPGIMKILPAAEVAISMDISLLK